MRLLCYLLSPLLALVIACSGGTSSPKASPTTSGPTTTPESSSEPAEPAATPTPSATVEPSATAEPTEAPPTATSPAPTATTPPAPTSPPGAAGTAAPIKGYGFPYQLHAPAGSTVIWTNYDAVAHDVTANDDSWSSGLLAEGESYSHTFTAPGTYAYVCRVHPYMTAVIIVE